MPFAIVNRLIEEYNTNGISAVLRADNILDIQMSSRPGSSFALSDYQLAAFKENNILPLEQGNGTVLAYPSTQIKLSDGKTCENAWRVAYGTEQENRLDAGAIQNELKNTYSGFTFNCVNIISLQDAMQDAEFKTPYTTASKTWRGGNSGWYDELADLGENVHGFQRSRWFKFASKKLTKNIEKAFKEVAQSRLADSSGTVSATRGSSEEIEVTVDEDGNEITNVTSTENYDADEGSLIGKSSGSAELQLAAKFTSMASTASEWVCAGVQGLMGIQTLVSAYQRVQKLNLVSGYMEAVQSVQAGSTESDPMHEYNTRLTTVDSETGKTAINAAGMGALFNDEAINADDASVGSINGEKALSKVSNNSNSTVMQLLDAVVGDANALLKAYTTCIYVKGGLSVLNAVVTGLSLVPGIGWGIAAISLSFKVIAKAAIRTAISIAVKIIAKAILKDIGKSLIKDVATDWLGEDLGNVLVSGGNTLLSSNHQIGGGSPASAANLGAFHRAQEAVIAEEAEYQRRIRSPFDVTSQYTFLGSIVYSLVPMANSAGVGSVMKNISSITSNSLSKLLPSASAIAETNTVTLAKSGDCQVLESVGIQGDAYCNPDYITDQTTIAGEDYTPEEIIQTEKDWGYITENNGKLELLSDGYARSDDHKNHLRYYILYCGQRTSSWGTADANIAESINQSSPLGTIIGLIPILGDLSAAASAANEAENLPWVTGSACVASESNEYWCENKIHQRFIEDQRFLENAGISNENAVTAYLKNYYEENPLDNSFEGILARYSGMTKDDVIATLELIDGLTYLANYHPEERLAFGKEEPKEIHFEQAKEVLIAEEPKYIVYETIRNRVVLV